MPDSYLNSSSEHIAALRELEPAGPVVMLNLLRNRQDGGRLAPVLAQPRRGS